MPGGSVGEGGGVGLVRIWKKCWLFERIQAGRGERGTPNCVWGVPGGWGPGWTGSEKGRAGLGELRPGRVNPASRDNLAAPTCF